MNKAIIGGTGVYNMAKDVTEKIVKTKYGDVTVDIAKINDEEIVFLQRHGKGHATPPHLVNYRANIQALKDLGIEYIYATVTVGSCNKDIKVGDVVVVNDFIDYTKNRINTFYDGNENGVAHTDMSNPYCENLREKFIETANKLDVKIRDKGVYVCTEGPRFETAKEIEIYSKQGGDLVGMTNVPEVVLAKELNLCYSAVGLVSNMCTGIESSNLAKDDISGNIKKAKENVIKIFLDVFKTNMTKDNCNCENAVLKL